MPRPEAGQQEEERNDQVQLQNQKGGQTGEQGGETQVADQQEQEAQPGEEEKAETLVQEESQLPPIGVPYQEQDPTFVDCFEPTEEVLSLLDLPAFFP